jgi:hypothetical protein
MGRALAFLDHDLTAYQLESFSRVEDAELV